MIVCAFAGQGSQRANMGDGLFARHPGLVETADRVLGYSIAEMCAAGGARLSQTLYTQPAVFVVNTLAYVEFEKLGVRPDYLLGHSLGEINALHAAGAFTFDTAVRIVNERAMLMSRHGGEGGMLALIGEREPLMRAVHEHPDVWAAVDNAPDQIVVSGSRVALESLEQQLSGTNVGDVIPLPVSGAFHSPLMASARERFAAFLAELEFAPLRIPVIANVSARPYDDAGIRTGLADLLVRPVRWADSIRYLYLNGPFLLHEIGALGVLAPLVRAVIASMPAAAIDAEEALA